MTHQRKRVEIRGTVQGVGFRPYVYRLAHSLGLRGFVLNHSEGVTIELEGSSETLESFLVRLPIEAPPLAQISDLSVSDCAPNGDHSFEIRRSRAETEAFALVPPDVGTCDDCLRDFTNPSNRRFAYPFTNCTNCGPRYTIILDVPYDRAVTTMAEFEMCPACRSEYENPLDRRFDAQPNACPLCGPALSRELGRIRDLLKDGRILAIKGLGGFHLACDAQNEASVQLLRQRKRRSDKAFALMVRDIGGAEDICDVSLDDRRALLGPRRPIVLMRRRPSAPIPAAVAPGNETLGVMLPYTPLHYLLFGESMDAPPEFPALVMTSGNLSEEPIVSANEDAPRLAALADEFVLHNRKIQTRVDDSVLRTFEGVERLVRRSRGYAPEPLDLGVPVRQILACGGELKNTFCLTKDHYAILSQHIGDLENIETLDFFRETIGHMQRFFRISPEAVAYDLHPGYLSTRFALELDGIPRIGVQHHHAHIASCMAEHRLSGKVIGVALDGTGYGTDGKIWGGEFLVCDCADFERRAHLRYIPLAGGDAGVREVWRSGWSYLLDTFGGQAGRLDLPLHRAIPKSKLIFVEKMIRGGLNTILTSSCGRLFDAAASLVGLRYETNYEGQAAIELEMLAAEGVEDSYGFDLAGDPIQIDLRPTIAAIVQDVPRIDRSVIAARFHNTVGDLVTETCRTLRDREGWNRVCLGGGTFQNLRLLRRSLAGLRRAGFEVYVPAKVPANDGGLSLGQALIANARLRTGVGV
jgi:hydrogenase maturation protein HypF